LYNIIELTSSEEERAEELHSRAIIIDTLQMGPAVWNDKIYSEIKRMVEENQPTWQVMEESRDMALREVVEDPETRQNYVQDLKTSGVTAVNYTVGTSWRGSQRSFRGSVKGFSNLHYLVDALPQVVKATKAGDIVEAKDAGKFAFIPGFQDTSQFEDDLEVLELFYRLGIRIIQLTYNMQNSVAVGTTDRYQDVAGLSYFGLKFVERLNDLGILVDVGHCGYQTTLDAVEASRVPIAATHTACMSVYEYPRAKTDEEIKAIAEKGGYIGIYAVPFFYPEDDRTINHLLDEIDHAVNIAGVEHIGIGLDYGNQSGPYPEEIGDVLYRSMWSDEAITKYGKAGFRPEHRVDPRLSVEGIETFSDWPNVTRGLVARGYSDEEILGILGGNFLDLFKKIVD
jgi:membrane dipeptidase